MVAIRDTIWLWFFDSFGALVIATCVLALVFCGIAVAISTRARGMEFNRLVMFAAVAVLMLADVVHLTTLWVPLAQPSVP